MGCFVPPITQIGNILMLCAGLFNVCAWKKINSEKHLFSLYLLCYILYCIWIYGVKRCGTIRMCMCVCVSARSLINRSVIHTSLYARRAHGVWKWMVIKRKSFRRVRWQERRNTARCAAALCVGWYMQIFVRFVSSLMFIICVVVVVVVVVPWYRS